MTVIEAVARVRRRVETPVAERREHGADSVGAVGADLGAELRTGMARPAEARSASQPPLCHRGLTEREVEYRLRWNHIPPERIERSR
jgi:hypothetical protein